MPREKRDRIERLDELWDLLDQSNISAKNIGRLGTLLSHPDPEVQELAALVLDLAHVHPHKRRRWRHVAARHRDLFHRAVTLLGREFFEDVLLDYGDTGGPLWRALEESRQAPPWTTRLCNCGSGRPFRDCCMARDNAYADDAASAAD
jgi:hypothetical protein